MHFSLILQHKDHCPDKTESVHKHAVDASAIEIKENWLLEKSRANFIAVSA